MFTIISVTISHSVDESAQTPIRNASFFDSTKYSELGLTPRCVASLHSVIEQTAFGWGYS